MAKQFSNKFLVKYEKTPKISYCTFEIKPLDIIDIPNPSSHSFKNEVTNLYKEYESTKDRLHLGDKSDGTVIIDEKMGQKSYWLMVECAGISFASKIFWKKMVDLGEIDRNIGYF